MQDKRRRIPTALYRLYDAAGDLLYIGVTSLPKARWHNHKRERSWWPQVARKDLEWHPNRSAALLAEKRAVETEWPRYNTIHHPIHEPAFIQRRRENALRWARGPEVEPYPEGVTWADVAGDLDLDQVYTAIESLNLTGLAAPIELRRRLQHLESEAESTNAAHGKERGQ